MADRQPRRKTHARLMRQTGNPAGNTRIEVVWPGSGAIRSGGQCAPERGLQPASLLNCRPRSQGTVSPALRSLKRRERRAPARHFRSHPNSMNCWMRMGVAVIVAAGILPAVEPGFPARRKKLADARKFRSARASPSAREISSGRLEARPLRQARMPDATPAGGDRKWRAGARRSRRYNDRKAGETVPWERGRQFNREAG